MLSIIIPMHNEEKTINKLLDSIFNSDFKDYEVIVVDDKSNDKSVEIAKRYKVKIIKNKINLGSAGSRNRGAKEAKGKVLVFLDADTVVHKDALERINKWFKRKDVNVLNGVYSKDSINRGFFPEYKALWDYYGWLNIKSDVVSTFEPRCGAIRKKLFNEVKGFNEKYSGASVEDIDFGYKVLEKSRIYYDMNIQVDHHFDSFKKVVKNFFKRSYLWMLLFSKKRKFESVIITPSNALRKVYAFLSLLAFPFIFFFWIAKYIFVILLAVYLTANMNFFIYLLKERGFIFMIKGIIYDYFLSIVVCVAGIFALISILLRRDILNLVSKYSKTI